MKSILAGLRQLVIPWGARTGDPRIVVGPDVPPTLVGHYGTDEVLAGSLMHSDSTRFYFDVLVNDGTNTYNAQGVVDESGPTVHEFRRVFISGPLAGTVGISEMHQPINSPTGIVIDQNDPLIQNLGAETGLLWYTTADTAFIAWAEESEPFQQWSLSARQQSGSVAKYIDVRFNPADGSDNEIGIGRFSAVPNVTIGGFDHRIDVGPNRVDIRGSLRILDPSGFQDPIQIGSGGNFLSAFNDRLTLYGAESQGPSDGVQIRVNDGTTTQTAFRSQTDAQLRMNRDAAATTGSAANLRVFTGDTGTDARIGVSTSRRAFKQDIYPAHDVSDAALATLAPVRFRDRREVAELGASAREYVGLVAEDVADSALPWLVEHDEHGEPFAVSYDRLGMALLPVVRRLCDRVAALEAELAALRGDSH